MPGPGRVGSRGCADHRRKTVTGTSRAQAWTTIPERGSQSAIRLGVWTARRLGRPLARLLLYPFCLYFFASSPSAVRASSAYLRRALGRAPR